MAFAAMATASAAYVLAVRMGGHGPFVAGLVTLSMLLCTATLPLWLAVQPALPRARRCRFAIKRTRPDADGASTALTNRRHPGHRAQTVAKSRARAPRWRIRC